MSTTKQITVRLSEDLVDWLDDHLDDDYPSRAALITQALKRAKRRQESRQNLAQFLAVEAAGPTAEDQEKEQWMATREFPDDDQDDGALPGAHAAGYAALLSHGRQSIRPLAGVVGADAFAAANADLLIATLRALGFVWSPPDSVDVRRIDSVEQRIDA